jgi:hypothetical protein
MLFAGAVLYRSILFSLNGAQPTSSSVVLGFYAIVSFSVVLLALGVVNLVRSRQGDLATLNLFKTREWVRVLNSALAGLSLTLFSFFYIGGIGFENTMRGYPVLYSAQACVFSCSPITFQLLPAVLDFGFWFAVTWLFLSGVPFMSSIIRSSLEGLVGVVIGLFVSVFALTIIYQSINFSDMLTIPTILLFDLTFGYIQLRRNFRVMGWAIIATGILLCLWIVILP